MTVARVSRLCASSASGPSAAANGQRRRYPVDTRTWAAEGRGALRLNIMRVLQVPSMRTAAHVPWCDGLDPDALSEGGP